MEKNSETKISQSSHSSQNFELVQEILLRTNVALVIYLSQSVQNGFRCPPWTLCLAGACPTGAFAAHEQLQEAGIESYLVVGNYWDSSHAFIVVKVDGKYYIADPTFSQFRNKKINFFEIDALSTFDLRGKRFNGYYIEDIFCDRLVAEDEFSIEVWGDQAPIYYWKTVKRISEEQSIA